MRNARATSGPWKTLLHAVCAASAFSAAAAPAQPKAPAPLAPTPTPAPRGAVAPSAVVAVSPAGLPAPGALHYTTDIGTCKRASGNEAVCDAILSQNAVAFYFTWSCTGPDCVIAGFRLRDANRPAASSSASAIRLLQSPGADALDTSPTPLFVERPPNGGWAGRCYDVTAYRTPVAKLMPDGSGGMKPAGGTTGSYEESPASQKVCIGSLTREVTLPAVQTRNFGRIYYFNRNTPKTTADDSPRDASWVTIGKMNMSQDGYSVVNKFYRAGAAFDASPLGDVTIHGGRFAYDTSHDCGPRLYSPAPSNWESSSFPRASGTPLAWSGTPGVGAVVRGWRAPKRLTFLLMESRTEGMDAEDFNYSAAMIGSCVGDGTNVRLVLDVGVTK